MARMIYERHGGLTNLEALEIVDIIIDIMKSRLLAGESVRIAGFGTLEVVDRKERRGRNPITGKIMSVRGRRALVFRPSKSIKAI